MAVVRIENVVKHYGAVEAVRGVSLECADGEMMALLGPSGCGKTTMLKMLAGIEDVTSGEIYFDDEPIADRDPSERNIAMVFEDYALYPRLSVAQNCCSARGFDADRRHNLLIFLVFQRSRSRA